MRRETEDAGEVRDDDESEKKVGQKGCTHDETATTTPITVFTLMTGMTDTVSLSLSLDAFFTFPSLVLSRTAWERENAHVSRQWGIH